uniref:DNA endonuclease activator Ctp1 C-terminal domain-containing protein n=1 Tax=Strongyloides venezuelensis TaxID=75913 RepID=A0A0K0FYY1_STRVS
MESRKSVNQPYLFQINGTNNQKSEIDSKNKFKNSPEKDIDKTSIPFLFSSEIPDNTSSSYSLKSDLQSRILKLKMKKKLEDKKLSTIHSKKDDRSDAIISKSQDLEIDDVNSDRSDHSTLFKEYTLREYLNIHTRIEKAEGENTKKTGLANKELIKDDGISANLNERGCDNLTTTCPKILTQLSLKYPPSSSISQISDTNTEKSLESLENKLLSSGFLTAYEEQATLPLKEYKKVDESKIKKAVRNKACRSTMQGYDCECCSGYYDALQLKTPEKLQRINEVSRHRGINSRCDKTPEGYWDKNFLKKSEQRKRGLLIESNSPIRIKKYNKKLKFSGEIEGAKQNPEG